MNTEGLLILIPAYNEAGAIETVVSEVRSVLPQVPILVTDDASTDGTGAAARRAGADVLSLPHHLGLGGCVQAGYKLAFELGYQYVIRIDGDGQHDARDIPLVYQRLLESGCQMVIGSRYADGAAGVYTSWTRRIGIMLFRLILRTILGRPVRDPTSGFVGVNRQALEVFAHSFPLEYPEIEALVVLQRTAFHFDEVPCHVRPRLAGKSSITPLRSLYYLVHVLLGVFVNVLRLDRKWWWKRFRRHS